jgi:hypothetical protein
VVKQHVAAATSGTTIVLDTDASAYGSDEQFGSGWLEARFETAVEVAASLCAAPSFGAEQLHLVTTSAGTSVQSANAGAIGSLLDVLAVVGAVAPVESAAEALPSTVTRTRCARAVVVTGTPSARLVQSMGRVRRSGTSVLVVRVGGKQGASLPGVKTFDIARVEDLV